MDKDSSADRQVGGGLLTVDQFCESHGISRAMFYRLQQRHEGPQLSRIGRRTLVSTEAAFAWRREVEARTACRGGGVSRNGAADGASRD